MSSYDIIWLQTIQDFIAHVYTAIYHATVSKNQGPRVTIARGNQRQELLTVLDGEKPTSKELPNWWW